ncbi:hypothetical protein ACHAWF_000136, partial [Thalassiosira exigua]
MPLPHPRLASPLALAQPPSPSGIILSLSRKGKITLIVSEVVVASYSLRRPRPPRPNEDDMVAADDDDGTDVSRQSTTKSTARTSQRTAKATATAVHMRGGRQGQDATEYFELMVRTSAMAMSLASHGHYDDTGQGDCIHP